MRILFLDDSSQCKDRYCGIGGVLFRAEDLSSIARRFNAIKQKHSIPVDEEIKWSPRRGSWIYKNLTGEKRFQVYSSILKLIARFDGTLFASVGCPYTDSRKLAKPKIMLNNIENLLERLDMCLRGKSEYGLIIADHERCHRDNRKLLQSFHEMQMTGTRFLVPERVPLNLLTASSHQTPFLQIADLVIGITVAMVSGVGDYAKQYFPLLRDAFHQGKDGQIAGYGLKLFPRILEERYCILYTND